MGNCRALVHYTFKKGMETQGLKFLENELVKKAQTYGCHSIELWQNERNPNVIIGVAVWNDIEDARRFQKQWEEKENELMKFSSEVPKREFFTCKANFVEKGKKAA
jgi:heme-degrading monooxygenase HmoA